MKTFILCFAITASLSLGVSIGTSVAPLRKIDPANTLLNLPEEFMCSVSDDKENPDTVLIYQSVNNDSLTVKYIK